MAVYKDKKRGTWYVSLYYTDWTGKQQRKLKRGFSTKKEAQDWERHFSLEKASSLDMTFGDFYKRYVYVSEVYDNAGKKITEDDGVATSFTVWVTPEEVESINTAVVYGGIQMYLKTE